MPGKSLRVFVTSSSPRSLKKITEFNWSGYAFYGTKEQLPPLAKRSETGGTGVYFLLSGINTEIVKMYVGETENFIKRIKNHHQSKDWWTHFIVFQSEGTSLNKAHVKYLEYVFWTKANKSTQIQLMNDQPPRCPHLSEEDVADLQTFEDNILYILEAINLGYFSRVYSTSEKINQTKAEYFMNVPNTEFYAYLLKMDEGYILKSSSYIKKNPRTNFHENNKGYLKKWEEIINSEQVIEAGEDVYQLQSDLEFSSASAAGAIVTGGSVNGLTVWKNSKTNAR